MKLGNAFPAASRWPLGVLAIAACGTLTGAVAQSKAHGHLQRLRETLTQLSDALRSGAADSAATQPGVLDAAARIDRLIGEVDQMVLEPEALMQGGVAGGPAPGSPLPCIVPAEPAEIFMSVSAADFLTFGSLGVSIIGNEGMQEFTFASGTTMQSMIEAINFFTPQTGVQAVAHSTFRFKLASVQTGADQYVAGIVNIGDIPIFFETGSDHSGESAAIDTGAQPIVPWEAFPHP